MKKIKLFMPHMELRIRVSNKMLKDYRECQERALGEDNRKDCNTCSWHEASIGDIDACDLVRPEQVLG